MNILKSPIKEQKKIKLLSRLSLVSKLVLFFLLTSVNNNLFSQINYSEDFLGCNGQPCQNWFFNVPGGSITAVTASGYSPCTVADPSARVNLSSTVTTSNFTDSVSIGISSGEFAKFGFSYKVLNLTTGAATAANSVTFGVQWASNKNGPWTSIETFQNVSSTACVPFISQNFFPPAGVPIFLRIVSTRNSGDFWVVFDNITLVQPAPSQILATACSCNNDQTPNNIDGTYNTALRIKYTDNGAMAPGLSYTITSSTGLNNTSGGPLGTPSFIQCTAGCPPGIMAGEYYLPVQVQPGGMYSAMVDGPDPNTTADLTLGNTTCATLYPALPIIPLQALNCLNAGINTFSSTSSVYSENNSLTNVVLPEGFSQVGTGSLTIDNDLVNEADNDPTYSLFLIRQNNGCQVSSYKEFKVFKQVVPDLKNTQVLCRPIRPKDTLYLSIMLDTSNTGGGVFTIPGVTVNNDKIGISGPVCYDVTYTITDSCGIVRTSTRKLQVTLAPDAAFNFSINSPVSPKCSSIPVSVDLIRTSSGANPQFSLTPLNTGVTTPIVGTTVSLPAPGIGGSIKYKICLSEESAGATACGTLPIPSLCRDTICKTYIVYRDRSDCGANALFTPNACINYDADLCPAETKPGLDIGCSFFNFTTPDILTSEVTIDQGIVNCDDASITGSYNVSLFGIDADFGGGGATIGSFPGISVVCSVLNFKVLGWRPLGSLYKLLGCGKTIAQFIFGFLSTLAGGDGGGYIVMADTDGDGAFDHLIKSNIGAFPGKGTFTVPNRVKGNGRIAVRAVGAWINSPASVCGNLDVEGKNLLDLLPIGAIPIVGSIIEDILAAASCNVNLALSVEATETVTVTNNSEPIFLNCNPAGYTFAQTLNCSLPVNWSIPTAKDGCNGESIQYRGVTSDVDLTKYAGTPATIPVAVTINQAGIYQTAGPVPGSLLLPGIYPVTYTAVSCNGLPTLCTFNVVVTSGNPILECPKDITVNTDTDLCTAVVNGLAPYQGAGCASIINYKYTKPISNVVVETTSTVKGTHNFPDGHIFELGTTRIEYTMQVDINGDGIYQVGTNEVQICSFNVVVQDKQLPDAVCLDVEVQLNNLGANTVYAISTANQIYTDGGSTDNCTGPLTIVLSKDQVTYTPTLNFDCSEVGQNVVTMKVTDANGNEKICKTVVKVLDYFEGYALDLDVPEVCFEPFQNTYDFSPYIVIARPNGQNISHNNVSTLGPNISGNFGISSFLPDPGSSNDPGTITEDGVYTLGTGTGWITISYILSIDGQVNQINDTSPLTGCYRMVHDIFRVEKLDPIWKGGFICCDQSPVWLGGANWNGQGNPIIPAGMLSLRQIRGDYPKSANGRWTGQGVSFQNPDGIAYSGDEFYQFNPIGLDGNYSITYTVGDEPCQNIYVQDIKVTCQDLHIELSDTTVCPATFIPERVILVNLDDDDLVVSTTGLAAVGGVDLVNVPVIDGRVVIPGFQTVAVRNQTFTIGVTTYQTSVFGCADYFEFTITVQDLLPPFFQNCPKEPIVVDALTDLCESFVNFEDPWADDQCFSLYTDIEQVDLTGKVSGDLFPVGTTILAYTATDTVGNQSYCELKIVVNDYKQNPNINCPADVVAVNDPGQCSAIINNIAPTLKEDNCIDNNAITYEVKDPTGKIIACGFENASGNEMPVGTNSVTYTMSDQPVVLITEIVQNGTATGVEVTNFGPAAIDLTCMKLSLRTATNTLVDTFLIPTRNNKSTLVTQVLFPPPPTTWVLPNPNIIPVGGTFTHNFAGLSPVNTPRKYTISFLDRIIDEVSINNAVKGEVLLRETECDHNLESDFIPATPCDPGSFGLLNPGLTTMTPNGKTTSLQNFGPNTDVCSFKVNVTDIEAPQCMKHDTLNQISTVATPLNLNQCLVSNVTMPAGIVNDVNLKNLRITIPNAGALTAYLNSPSGTRIKLFDGLCNGQPNVNVTLDEHRGLVAAPSINTAPCNPLGGGLTFRPEESFKAFYGEPSGGTWTLEMWTAGNVTGQLISWNLELLNETPYAQQDTTLENELTKCTREFSWIHPVFKDNCCEGTMDVTYEFSNDVTGETSTENAIIQSLNGIINIDGTRIKKTFKVGKTKITYKLVDKYGIESECGFTVTILDTEKPTFPNGCANQIILLKPGECDGALPVIPATNDNCAIDTFFFCYSNGDPIDIKFIPIGLHSVTMKSVDIYGNISLCVFDVDVVEYIPTSDALACNDNINLSLGVDCTVELTTDMILEGGPYRCYENYCIKVTGTTGTPHSNIFTLDDVGKSFTVSIIDCLGGQNSCWGYVHIEEKLIPQIKCPDDVTLYCNADKDERYPKNHPLEGKLLTGELELLTCEPASKIIYQDEILSAATCSTPRAQVKRTWQISDQSGNIVSCDQFITFESYDADDIDFPKDFNGANSLNCGAVIKNPDLVKPINTGVPTINGKHFFGQHYCDINVGYWDEFLQDANCGAGYELLRHWIIRNECQPLLEGVNPLKHIQSIKVDDKKAPSLLNLADVTISTGPWSCDARYKLPDVVHDEDCSTLSVKWNVSYGLIKDGYVNHLLKGKNTLKAIVTDACGNVSKTSLIINVHDKVAPVAEAKQNIVLSLTGSGTSSDGQAKLYATAVNNGSYDYCSDIKLEVRRPDGAPSCGNEGVDGHNNNVTFNNNENASPAITWAHPEDDKDDTDNGEFVKFCCEDLAGSDSKVHQVMLRVWDDGNMNGIIGDNLIIDGMQDNYNDTWADIRVENKLPPTIVCPIDATVTCDMDLNISTTWKDVAEVALATGEATAYDLCAGVKVEYKDTPSWTNTCENVGRIRREFRAVKGTRTVNCYQTITVSALPSTFVVTPPSNSILDAPCDFDISDIKTSDKPKVQSGPCDVIGENIDIEEFLFEDGVCRKWKVTYNYINWCTNETKGPYFKYYKYKDDEKPVLTCADQMFAANPNSQNPNGGCEGTVNLEASATDGGGCITGGWLKWTVIVDLWGNGTSDYEFTSFLPTTDNNLGTDTNGNGIPDRYVAPTADGQTVKIPAFVLDAEMSTHKVSWKVSDGCGNVTSCNSTFMVVDKKAPTPYCVSISTAVMENGQVELWAIDFNKGSFDNCTPQNSLLYTFNGENPVLSKLALSHYFKGAGLDATVAEYNAGNAQRWVPEYKSSAMIFNCDDVKASPFTLRMSVWDGKLNTDFCEVTLTIIDNQNACDGSRVAIGGDIQTDKGEGIKNVNVELNCVMPNYPKNQMSDINGDYMFAQLPMHIDYTVRGIKRDDWMNGVSTLDLILIQRHILGVNKFDSPYKIIAADVNNDGKVTASDLVSLRKLILGVIAELPNNNSWRFLDAKAKILNPNSPWPIDEVINIAGADQNMMKENFIGLKVGDVDGNAQAATGVNLDTRSKKVLEMKADDKVVKEGEVIELPIRAKNFSDIYGYQFTSSMSGLEVIGMLSGALEVDANNYGTPKAGLMTMSWANDKGVNVADGEVLFTIQLKAKNNGKLSEMMAVNSDITRAESYAGASMEVNRLNINFTKESTEAITELYQNEPNPFKDETVIKYNMAAAGKANFTIYDITGKQILVKEVEANKGMNTLKLTRGEINGSGVVYYQMEAGEFKDTKKMIIID